MNLSRGGWRDDAGASRVNFDLRRDVWFLGVGNEACEMTNDQWFAVVMIAVSAFLGWCVTMAVYDIALWGAV